MTNLENFEVPIHIHLNIDETFDFIDANLPQKYSSAIKEMLPEGNTYPMDYIRKVKRERINNAVIISCLYFLAKRHFDNKNLES
ncbi:hypothetical protein ACFQO9_04680 [Chryseobacterium zhengzhouense]|uniref:Uncharacterized protein n=1 Tax=Chryseobacterium zhengzhouense TaxID=1636086 RepID=A0ABW2LWC7_9FLAO